MKKFLIAAGVAGVALAAFFWMRKNSEHENATVQENNLSSTGNFLNTTNDLFVGAITETNLLVKSLGNLGIKNNNPLNIRYTPNAAKKPWVGQVGENGGFVVFSAPEYGFRAAAKLLKNYFAEGDNTIEKVVSRWAPPTENNTPVYISYVQKHTGINKSRALGVADLPILIRAMAKMETGKDWPIDIIFKGIGLL